MQTPFTRPIYPFPAAVLAKGSQMGFPESPLQVLLLGTPTQDTSLIGLQESNKILYVKVL